MANRLDESLTVAELLFADTAPNTGLSALEYFEVFFFGQGMF